MEARTIQVDSQTINYYESAGTGPAALLVHGNSSSGLAFRRQIESELGRKYRLVAMDLPGHGRSQPALQPAEGYTLPGYARAVAAVADKLGLGRAVYLGWSLGGHIVLEGTNLLPEAAGFVIYGTPPLAYPPDMAAAFLPHPAMGAGFTDKPSEAEMDAYVAAFFKPGTTDLPESFLSDIRLTDGRARAVMGASIGPGNYRDEVKVVEELKVPLAVLQGREEQLVSLAYLQSVRMPTLWRGAVQVVQGAGHAPQWEQPEKFNELLEAFIQDCNR